MEFWLLTFYKFVFLGQWQKMFLMQTAKCDERKSTEALKPVPRHFAAFLNSSIGFCSQFAAALDAAVNDSTWGTGDSVDHRQSKITGKCHWFGAMPHGAMPCHREYIVASVNSGPGDMTISRSARIKNYSSVDHSLKDVKAIRSWWLWKDIQILKHDT